MIECKYKNIEYFQKLFLLLFNLNVCSVKKHFNKFHILLNELNIDLDIIAIMYQVSGIMPCKYSTPKPFY